MKKGLFLTLFLALAFSCGAAPGPNGGNGNGNGNGPTAEDRAIAAQLGMKAEEVHKIRTRFHLSGQGLVSAGELRRQMLLWEADHPEFKRQAAEQEFRLLKYRDEHGNIPTNGLKRALQQHQKNQHLNHGHGKGNGHHDDDEEDPEEEGDLFPAQPDPSTNSPDFGIPPLMYAGLQSNKWSWLGPGNIGGRVRAIVPHPTLTNVLWCGGVDGGVWKTTNAGVSWFVLNDFMGNMAIASLAMDPSNTNVLYAGTGEGTYNADSIRGAGIFKSYDGGTNWIQLSGTDNANFQYVNRLAIAPTNSQLLLAATRSGIWRSANGGTNWTQATTSEAVCVAFHPTNSSSAIASGYNGHAYVTGTAGQSWATATGIPSPGGFAVARVEVAYSRSNPQIIYASADTNSGSLYRSTDGGRTYSLRSTGYNYLGNQGWYDNAVWADPVNTNVVIVGGTDVYRSTDGGVTFTDIGGYSGSIHPDQHVIVASPLFNGSTVKTIYVGNDGGVFRATDAYTASSGSGWTSLNHNLGITQFYGAAGNANTSVIVGGTQDNGTLRYTTGGGPQGWTAMFGGDGGICAADPANPNYFYGEYVYLQIHRSANGGGSSSYIYSGIGDAGNSSVNFIAPFILDPNNANTMLAGGLSLWRSTNVKNSPPAWTSIKASVGSPISAIAVAPGNSDIIWVGHNNGAIYFTVNGTSASPTWTLRTSGLPARYCTCLTIAPNAARVYVTFGGFNSGNVWQTSNSGNSWVNIGNALPAAPMNSIAISPSDTNTLYVGSEVGVYGSYDNGVTWATGNNGPANVAVDQLFWMGSDLVAATHGRGLWITTPLPGGPLLSAAGFSIGGGNGGGLIDPNECNYLNLSITNAGGTDVTDVSGTLTTTTPGVSFVPDTASFPAINSTATVTNLTAFRINTSAGFVCGSPVVVKLSLTYAQGTTNISYTLPSVGAYTVSQSSGNVIVPGDTDTGNHGDNDATTISLPFPITFYGQTFSTASVTANGTLQFLSTNTSAANTCLPAGGFNYSIFPFWTDLRTDLTGQGIFTGVSGSAPNRTFAIEWRASLVSSSADVNFEVLLYESQARVDFIYGALNDPGSTATVGIQRDTGSSYTNFACNAGGLSAGLQLAYQWNCNDGGGTCPPLVVANFAADSVAGSPPLLVNFTNLTTGATNYSWSFGDGHTSTSIDPTNYYTNAGTYTVTLTAVGPGGTNTMTKNNYIKVTNAPPVITLQPVNTMAAIGSNATFMAAATGTPPLSFQWRFAGVPLANATNATLTLSNVSCALTGNYDVAVSNAAAVTYSTVAVLTVVGPPGIATQPVDQTVVAGQTASFSVTGTNACGGGLVYQWQLAGTNLSGATNTTLIISNAQPADAGAYDVVLSDFAGSITSQTAMLTVNPAVSPVLILWPSLSDTNFVFYFETSTGKTYTVEYKDLIDVTNWLTLSSAPGDGTTNRIAVPIGNAVQRFYRLNVQ